VVNHRQESMSIFAQQFAIPRQYTSLDDLIAAGEVDAISINSPNYLHAPQTIRTLEAGLHVMVEKPMAMNADEARQMNRRQRTIGCEIDGRSLLALRSRSALAQATLGCGGDRVDCAHEGCGVHVHWGPSGWFTQAKYAGGGALVDMGIHAIDMARFLLGDQQPVRVYADIRTEYGDYDVDDTGTILITWDNGATSTIEIGLVAAAGRWP